MMKFVINWIQEMNEKNETWLLKMILVGFLKI